MKSLPAIAQGDSFAFDFSLTDADDNPVNIGDARGIIATQDFCFSANLTWTADGTDLNKGVFSATPAETAIWPVTGTDTASPLVVRVEVTNTIGFISSLEPLSLTVMQGVPNA